jgi:site-specific DNA recombinase
MSLHSETVVPAAPLRCAIYTRKSTEEGLNQPFNSLEAQREAGEAYVLSQRHAGWIVVPERYDDGGYTGGNLDRPALQRLLGDIQSGIVDCVVVYKVDRLSRSLLDFARLMEVLERHEASLVSVTQPLNTTVSLGRLTLNILLSFAQFEREIIAERTQDKMSAAKKKGKWVGGLPVLGYEVAPGGGKLIVHREEARRVQELFALYLECESVDELWETAQKRGCSLSRSFSCAPVETRDNSMTDRRGRHLLAAATPPSKWRAIGRSIIAADSPFLAQWQVGSWRRSSTYSVKTGRGTTNFRAALAL